MSGFSWIRLPVDVSFHCGCRDARNLRIGSYASWGQDREGTVLEGEKPREARASPRKPRPGAFAGEQASLFSWFVACSPYPTAPR